MAGVFVSYAREDATKAQVIARALEQASFDVWFDQRMQSGSEFSREIEEALKSSAAVVVLWSRNSIESAWVRDEAAEGRDSGRLVPVLLDAVRPPIGFRQFQTTDLSRWSGRGNPKQLAEITAAIAAKTGTAASQTPAPRIVWWKRPAAWAAAGATFVLAAIAIIFLAGRAGSPVAMTPTIVILPFTADASDPDARKLASAVRESVAHTLSHGAFDVSTIEATPPNGRPTADFLITGQVSSTPGKFAATVRMEETAHHYVVFSRQFETSRDKVGDLAELIGAQVAATLSWTAPILAMERQHPSDPAITAALLQSSVESFDSVSTLHDYETSRRLAAKAPDSPMAQNGLAFHTGFALGDLPQSDRADAVAAARRANERTVQLAPEFGGGYIPWCLLHSEVRKIECEDRLRAAMRAAPDDPFTNFFLASLVLNPVGRNREAAELASLSLAHDPYMPFKIGLALRTFEATGRTVEAADLYRKAARWWPDNPYLIWFRGSGMILRGDFEAAQQFGEETGGQSKPSPALIAINGKSLPALRTACSRAKDFDAIMCMLAFARFGDLDAAFALADRLYPSRVGRTPADQERIWLDNPGPSPVVFLTAAVAAPLRQDPRYLALAQRVGLLDYWRSGRLPDFCRNKPEPICSKLARG